MIDLVTRTLLGAPGLTTRSEDATSSSWPYYLTITVVQLRPCEVRPLAGRKGFAGRRLSSTLIHLEDFRVFDFCYP